MRFSSDATIVACVDSNYYILNPFVPCGEFHADIETNLGHNQHEPVTQNLESSGTCHSPQPGEGEIKRCSPILKSKLAPYAKLIVGDKDIIFNGINSISYLILSMQE